MGSVIIMYIGFFVSALIIVWAVITVSRRLHKPRKADARAMHTWEPLQSSSDESIQPVGTEDSEHDAAPHTASQSRAQQNGHYSESKKL